jgi:protoporphyrinogen oxidase
MQEPTPSRRKVAIIAGAGPAGLTAAYELLTRTDILPIIFEKSSDIGGISKTVNYKNNRIDIGGHRFFSKSDRVMNWWLNIMPVQDNGTDTLHIHYQNKERTLERDQFPFTDNDEDLVLLVRERLSRIYYLKKFFNYPIQLSVETLLGLGLLRSMKIFISYVSARLSPIKNEKSLEDFMINRFGKELYLTFFKDYTEKVWGIDCKNISPEWGAQRIKGLSITQAIRHALKQKKKKDTPEQDIRQKGTETSLIEKFLYPKYGPGQMWEEVARMVQERGGLIKMNCEVDQTHHDLGYITSATIKNTVTGEVEKISCDYFFSTMPIKQLVTGLNPALTPVAREIAQGLMYRDFITVGLLLDKLKIRKDKNRPAGPDNTVADNWIYIQERDVMVGRLQIFNNWSPFMVADPDKVWIGMEYFCNEGDTLWNMPDDQLKQFAIKELAQIDIIHEEDVRDSTVLRMEKAYPAYFGTYDRFDELKNVLNDFPNLFLIGRNGMHKYNNSDHSMLTAMVAVDNIVADNINKENLWKINTEMEYHEEHK